MTAKDFQEWSNNFIVETMKTPDQAGRRQVDRAHMGVGAEECHLSFGIRNSVLFVGFAAASVPVGYRKLGNDFPFLA